MTLNEFIKAHTLPTPNKAEKVSAFLCSHYAFSYDEHLEKMFKSRKIRAHKDWDDESIMRVSMSPRDYENLIKGTVLEELLI